MRRLYKVFVGIFAVFFVILCLFAFVDPVRIWMQINIGPLVLAVFGGIIVAVTTSPIWLQYVAPTLNAWLIGLALGIVPVSFPLIHRAFNKYRGFWVKSADEESGHTYLQERPISQQTTTPEPKKTSKPPTPAPPLKTETPPPTPPKPKQEETSG